MFRLNCINNNTQKLNGNSRLPFSRIINLLIQISSNIIIDISGKTKSKSLRKPSHKLAELNISAKAYFCGDYPCAD